MWVFGWSRRRRLGRRRDGRSKRLESNVGNEEEGAGPPSPWSGLQELRLDEEQRVGIGGRFLVGLYCGVVECRGRRNVGGRRVIVLVGFSLLMIGAMSNSKSKATCGFGHRHFLSIGGILCFAHGLFTVAYYSSAIASWDEGKFMGRPRQAHP
ncbi:hypothetical protein M5K25_019428 [Dendrobium thyrsiflorum]|uniref:Uncharacterized protein n=1 Tax=Dendrobium thyrsiflorum TaxID=117978 RepID=A0ABD0UFD5_DENTH